jgi:hypothetical protein
MELETSPVDFDVVLPFQPDQAAALGNEAERSDEIGEEFHD